MISVELLKLSVNEAFYKVKAISKHKAISDGKKEFQKAN